MTTKRRLGLATGILAIAVAVAAWAQPPTGGGVHSGQGMGHGRGMGPGQDHVEQMMTQLNLTDAQKQQVRQLMSANREKSQGVMQQMMTLHQQLRDQIFADSGPGDTSALQAQIKDLIANMMQSQIELHEQISKILTPEQRKKMREMPMPGMMGMGMGMPGHGPGR